MKNGQVSCITGCYQLHLYCANRCDDLNRPSEYTGPTGRYCRAEARRDGWLVNTRANHALCPNCSGKKPRRLTTPQKGKVSDG